MPLPNPRRLTGRALRVSARASEVPVLRAGVRLVGRGQLGLEALREARIGPVPPAVAPPLPRPRRTP
ncbi:hypothetical protein [Euzebya sp.]|uniref:hypothetical protein n=1 Tax=Euzebya sp. TaxID=1971409 RepID=UPI003517820F